MSELDSHTIHPVKDVVMGERAHNNYDEPESEPEDFFSRKIFGGDRVLWIIILMLAILSLLVVFSSTASLAYMKAGGDTSYYLMSQLRAMVFSFALIFIVHRVRYQTYAKYARIIFIGALIMMLLTFFIGVNLNDASRWLQIPKTNLTVQPSDFLKVALILILAKELAKRQATINKTPLIPKIRIFGPKLTQKQKRINRDIFFENTLPLLLPIVLTCGTIFLSNLSTAGITFCTCLFMLYIGRVKKWEIFRLVKIVVLSMIFVLGIMYAGDIGRSRTWVNRLTGFVGIEQVESKSDNLQVEQAKIAIASGGLFGKGPGMSTQRANLPHSYSDFAYAFIAEEYGLVGAILVLALYLWLFFRTIIIFQKCERAFPSLLVLGLGVMIVLQAILNMLVSVNLMPVTGQTLPLVSMGGSSLLFTSGALGMILGVSRQMQEKTLGSLDEDE